MSLSGSITLFFQNLNREYVLENYETYFISKKLDPVSMEENIHNHLNTIFKEHIFTEQDELFEENGNVLVLTKTINAFFFIQTVLYVNKIDVIKYGDILISFFKTKDEFLVDFLGNLKEAMIVYGSGSVPSSVFAFLRILFLKEQDIFEVFCNKYFSYCLLKNDPLGLFELGLLNEDCWLYEFYFEDCIDKFLIRYIDKTENFKKKLISYMFGEDEVPRETRLVPISFANRLNLIIENTKNLRVLELFLTVIFENCILMNFVKNLDFEFFFKTIKMLYHNYSMGVETVSVAKRYQKIMDLFNRLSQYNQQLPGISDEKLSIIETYFYKKVSLLLECIASKYHKLDYTGNHVTFITLKKKYLLLDSDLETNSSSSNLLLQNELIKESLSEKIRIDLEALNDSEQFIKQYNFENLIFSSRLTNFVISSPFIDPFKNTGNFPLKLNLNLHLYEYLLLMCFEKVDALSFKTMKYQFYKHLDSCYPTVLHNDTNSQELLKITYKKFYQQNLMISLNDKKKLKWNSFLAIWGDCFERNYYGNLKVMLIFNPSQKLNKTNYVFDESLKEYVYIL